MQKRADSGSAVPHAGQRRASGAAQLMQNLAWGGFSVVQAGHCIGRSPDPAFGWIAGAV